MVSGAGSDVTDGDTLITHQVLNLRGQSSLVGREMNPTKTPQAADRNKEANPVSDGPLELCTQDCHTTLSLRDGDSGSPARHMTVGQLPRN